MTASTATVAATTRVATTVILASIGFGQSALPRLPFSGSYGATMGAGSAVGWGRDGNPAILESGSMGASLAGYSPFGLDGISVLEAGLHADGRRFGTSLAHRRADVEDAASASSWRWQTAMLLRRGWSAGLALKIQEEGKWDFGRTAGGSAAAGMLYNQWPFFSAGAFAEKVVAPEGRAWAVAIGADAGLEHGSTGWRIGGEGHFDSREGIWRWRTGLALALHRSLSVQGGWAPDASSFALGLRFGMGSWEGYHAMRKHAFLGSTSVQGLEWTRLRRHPPD